MADPRFFDCHGPMTAKVIAEIAKAELVGNPDLVFHDVAALDKAEANTVSFLDNRKYLKAFQTSKAGLCIVHPQMASHAPDGMNLLITEQPYMAYAMVSRAFYPDPRPKETIISERSNVAESATVGKGVTIDPGAYIGENVVIGDNSWIKANAVICDGVEIGQNCVISHNVTLTHCVLGHHVTIHSGCQIGQEGFGFASGPQGHVRIPQLGRVIIGNGVNIGANTTIDRGAGPDTIIGDGCQIDNLVQIGHNVQMGLGCVIVSQVGISGSTKLGNFVVMGGQVGVAGHLEIADFTTYAAKSGVMRSVTEPKQTFGGIPAIPQKDWLRQCATLARLTKARK